MGHSTSTGVRTNTERGGFVFLLKMKSQETEEEDADSPGFIFYDLLTVYTMNAQDCFAEACVSNTCNGPFGTGTD